MTEKYALFGNPVSHSRSPYIHTCFAGQFNQIIDYQAICINHPDEFTAKVQAFIQNGGKGANVTVPYKELAISVCDELSVAAELAGAVNTLIVTPQGKIKGDNSDGLGLVNDLQVITTLTNKRILLIGAGGAARGCILPLLQAGIASLSLSNRTASKAQQLVSLFAPHVPAGVEFKCDELANLSNDYDIIINSTSASLTGELPAIPEHTVTDCICYDMMYGKGNTVFNQWALAAGARQVYDGLGMLVGQAAVSFGWWRNQQPITKPVLAALRQQLEQA
ncbi:shikimate dehydrogenase [Shewanella sp. NIFS-20-20]|uniref:shikimate dehydrogenase n=1 Tax=Shewanella sp. NIFS-20-20 TaxID=2853806 RepID=UPI001C45D84C|nr:shikimate dehydrogenase [Shewanella sp. NIFS-20-20]MBV7315556.1 shikimate dehydrogenase [Shewanella sp. NIFS-20-20]